MGKKVLIVGISGQDGTNLAQYLLHKKYKVYGIYRGNKKNLNKRGISKKVKLFKLIKINEKKLNKILKIFFDEIYFLGGQSSVFKSFEETEETYKSQIIPVKIIIEFIRNQKKNKSKFLFASSSEIYGKGKKNLNFKEDDNKNPISPYALSKLICYEIIKSYRKMFKLPICCAILFNHDSELRDKTYVMSKLANFLNQKQISTSKKLIFGNIRIKRDWGWSFEYMVACHKILNSKKIEDYNIATGKTVSFQEVIKYAFKKTK